jgi:hypothetical protein
MPCNEFKKLKLAHETAVERIERYANPENDPKLIVTSADPVEPKLKRAKAEELNLRLEMDDHLLACESCVPQDQKKPLLFIASQADSSGNLSEEASAAVFREFVRDRDAIGYLYRDGFLNGKQAFDSLVRIDGLTDYGRQAVAALSTAQSAKE